MPKTLPKAAAVSHTKAKQYEGPSPKSQTAPKTLQEFEAQDAADEAKPRRMTLADPIDDMVGTAFKTSNESLPDWKDRNGRRFVVSRFYPHKNLVIDYLAQTEAQAQERKAVLNALGMGYVYVLPGQGKRLSVSEKEKREKGYIPNIEDEIKGELPKCKKPSKV